MSTRSAIVTGSTSGIGWGIADALAGQGMNILLNGLSDPAEVEPLMEDLKRRHGVEVDFSAADMSQPGQVREMVAQAEAAFGSIDVLVNNAGIQHVAPTEKFPDDKWDAILAINLSAAFHATKAVLPGMLSRRWGRIINLASAHGLVASPHKPAYVAAKHGLLGLTKTVALETAEQGITVNAVCPGYVRTPLVEDQIPATAKERGLTEEQVVRDVLLHAQPTRQFVETGQVGALVGFLCSEAAASITGAALPIDGGWTAQ